MATVNMLTSTPSFQLHVAYSTIEENINENWRPPTEGGMDISQLNDEIAAETKRLSRPYHDVGRRSQRFKPPMVIQLHDENQLDNSTDAVSCAIDALATSCGIEPTPRSPVTRPTFSKRDMGWEFIKVLRLLLNSSKNGLPTDVSLVDVDEPRSSENPQYIHAFPQTWELVHLLHHDRGWAGGMTVDSCNIPAKKNQLLRSELLCALSLLREDLDEDDESQKQAFVVTITPGLKVRAITASLYRSPASPGDDVELHVMVGQTLDFSGVNDLEHWTSEDHDHWKSILTKLMRQVITSIDLLAAARA